MQTQNQSNKSMLSCFQKNTTFPCSSSSSNRITSTTDWDFFIPLDDELPPKKIITKYKPSIVFLAKQDVFHYYTKIKKPNPHRNVIILEKEISVESNDDALVIDIDKKVSVNYNQQSLIRTKTNTNTITIYAYAILSCLDQKKMIKQVCVFLSTLIQSGLWMCICFPFSSTSTSNYPRKFNP